MLNKWINKGNSSSDEKPDGYYPKPILLNTAFKGTIQSCNKSVFAKANHAQGEYKFKSLFYELK